MNTQVLKWNSHISYQRHYRSSLITLIKFIFQWFFAIISSNLSNISFISSVDDDLIRLSSEIDFVPGHPAIFFSFLVLHDKLNILIETTSRALSVWLHGVNLDWALFGDTLLTSLSLKNILHY